MVRFMTLDMHACKVLDDVTCDGRLFHVFAAATGKARSPIVRRTMFVVHPVAAVLDCKFGGL